MSDTQPVLVSQSAEGGHGNTYYIPVFRKSLGGFDKDVMLKDIMGDDGMAKLAKTISETESSSESAIYRYRPDMSYPPRKSSTWPPTLAAQSHHGRRSRQTQIRHQRQSGGRHSPANRT